MWFLEDEGRKTMDKEKEEKKMKKIRKRGRKVTENDIIKRRKRKE